MNLAWIIFGVSIYHFAAINGLSLISGRYSNIGLLDDNSLLLGRAHVIGVSLAILAIGAFYWSLRTEYLALAITLGTGLMIADLLCIFRMLRR